MCKPNDPSIAHFSTWIQQGSPAASHADTLHSTHPRITNHLRVSHRHPGRVRTHLPTTVRPSGPGTGTAAEEKGRRQKQAQTTNPSVHGRTDEHTTQSRNRCNGSRQADTGILTKTNPTRHYSRNHQISAPAHRIQRTHGQGQSNGINFCLVGFPTLPRQRCSVPCKVSLLFASRRNCGVPHYF